MKLLVSAWVLALLLCSAEARDPFLLMVASNRDEDNNGTVATMDLKSYEFTYISITDYVYWPVAVDFDSDADKIYWSEASAVHRRIRRSDFDGGNVETVYTPTHDDSVIGGLAVDWMNGLIFYTEETIDIIGKLTLPGFDQSVVINENLDRPRAIALNTEDRVIFWADIGPGTGAGNVERANYDGSERLVLVSGLNHVSGLTLDVDKSRVYWVDAGPNKVEYIDMEGSGRSVVFDGASQYTFYGLALYDDILYFAEWGPHAYDTNDSRVSEVDLFGNGYIVGTFNSHRLNDFHAAGASPPLLMARTGWTGVTACLSVVLALTLG